MSNFFRNDSLDDLGATLQAPARTELPTDPAFVRIREEKIGVVENCPKCRGTGRFVSYSGRVLGNCFACKGAGKLTFKNSAPVRAANREKVAARAERKAQATWADFVEQFPAQAAWIESRAPRFTFAAEMKAAVVKFGDLTPGKMAAIDRMMAADAERDAQRAGAAQQVASTGYPNLRAVFDAVVARGAKKAQMTIDGVNISLASLNGRNPGALYVKDDGEYAGKIVGTTFRPGFAAKADLVARLNAIEANPTAAIKDDAARRAARLAKAEAEGRQEEVPCGCCGILLTDPVSRARGIGPICAGKWGF